MDRHCNPDCPLRKDLEAENLPEPTVPQACQAAAALLVMDEVALGECPLSQIPLDE